MRLKFIPLIIMLIAGLAACIVTFINKYSVLESLIVILAALIIFYILGLIIRKILVKFLVIHKENKIESTDDIQDNQNISIEEQG